MQDLSRIKEKNVNQKKLENAQQQTNVKQQLTQVGNRNFQSDTERQSPLQKEIKSLKAKTGDEGLNGLPAGYANMNISSEYQDEIQSFEHKEDSYYARRAEITETEQTFRDKVFKSEGSKSMENIKECFTICTNFREKPVLDSPNMRENYLNRTKTGDSLSVYTELAEHLKEMAAVYASLINAVVESCQEYIDKHNPWTSKGKERLKLVKDLKESMEQDRRLFEKEINDIASNVEGRKEEFTRIISGGAWTSVLSISHSANELFPDVEQAQSAVKQEEQGLKQEEEKQQEEKQQIEEAHIEEQKEQEEEQQIEDHKEQEAEEQKQKEEEVWKKEVEELRIKQEKELEELILKNKKELEELRLKQEKEAEERRKKEAEELRLKQEKEAEEQRKIEAKERWKKEQMEDIKAIDSYFDLAYKLSSIDVEKYYGFVYDITNVLRKGKDDDEYDPAPYNWISDVKYAYKDKISMTPQDEIENAILQKFMNKAYQLQKEGFEFSAKEFQEGNEIKDFKLDHLRTPEDISRYEEEIRKADEKCHTIMKGKEDFQNRFIKKYGKSIDEYMKLRIGRLEKEIERSRYAPYYNELKEKLSRYYRLYEESYKPVIAFKSNHPDLSDDEEYKACVLMSQKQNYLVNNYANNHDYGTFLLYDYRETENLLREILSDLRYLENKFVELFGSLKEEETKEQEEETKEQEEELKEEQEEQKEEQEEQKEEQEEQKEEQEEQKEEQEKEQEEEQEEEEQKRKQEEEEQKRKREEDKKQEDKFNEFDDNDTDHKLQFAIEQIRDEVDHEIYDELHELAKFTGKYQTGWIEYEDSYTRDGYEDFVDGYAKENIEELMIKVRDASFDKPDYVAKWMKRCVTLSNKLLEEKGYTNYVVDNLEFDVVTPEELWERKRRKMEEAWEAEKTFYYNRWMERELAIRGWIDDDDDDDNDEVARAYEQELMREIEYTERYDFAEFKKWYDSANNFSWEKEYGRRYSE